MYSCPPPLRMNPELINNVLQITVKLFLHSLQSMILEILIVLMMKRSCMTLPYDFINNEFF